MASGLIRWNVVSALLAALRNHPDLDGVQISSGWPGDTITPESLWVDQLDGTITYPVFGGGPLPHDDDFSTALQIRVVGYPTLDDTYERLLAICSAVVRVLSDDATLGAVDGIRWALPDTVKQSCGDVAGVGPMGFAEIVVKVESRIS